MRLFLFTVIEMVVAMNIVMPRGSSFSLTHAQMGFVKKSSLITVESDFFQFVCFGLSYLYLTVGSGNLDNALYMCAIFLFIHFFYANNKKSKSSSCEWILYLDWDEISFLLMLCYAQQGKSAARIFFSSVSHSFHRSWIFHFLFMHISRLYYERMNGIKKKI